MKKVLACFLILTSITGGVIAQETSNIRPAALGLSFFFNDFTTAQRIRSTSFGAVRSAGQWAKFSEQSPGFALTYFKGLKSHLDFAGTLAASFVDYPVGNSTSGSDGFLLEGDASTNLKLFSDQYVVSPYLNAGVGVSKYKSYWGAFIPLGLGLKVNLFNESDIFVNFQYRVPVTKETSNYHFFTSIGITGLLGGPKAE